LYISSFTEKYVIKPGFWAGVGSVGHRRFCIPSLFFFLHILQKILTLLSQKLRNKVGKKFENGHLFLSFFTFMKIVYENGVCFWVL
jgi:hypothetical protein